MVAIKNLGVGMVDTFPYDSIIQWDAASRTLGGEAESGDLYIVKSYPNGVLTGVVDGAGHGHDAAAAAKIAVATLGGNPEEPLIALVKRCHQNLLNTRGVAMTLAAFDVVEKKMAWLGVGNVEGVICRAGSEVPRHREKVLLGGGIVGFQLPSLRPMVLPVEAGDVLILATDGIKNEFIDNNLILKESTQKIADNILNRYAKENDDALVLVVRYTGNDKIS